MKAKFKVPHATSNKPKKPYQGSDLCEISNYASRASSFPKKFAKAIVQRSAGTYPDVSRAGIKGRSLAVRSYRRRERRSRTGAGGGQADSRQRSGGGRSGAGGGRAAGDRTRRTQTGQLQWSWRRTSGPRQCSGALAEV